MKIALLSYNFAPEPVGIPYFNTAMLRWLSGQPHVSVCVHTGVPHYPWWNIPDRYRRIDYRWGRGDEILFGVPVHRVWHYVPSHPVTAFKRIRLDLSYLWHTWLRSFRNRTKPDVIILIAPPFLSGLLGLFLRWRWRCTLIYHIQDLQVDAAIDLKILPQRLARVLVWIERFLLERMDLVSTISASMRERVQKKAHTRRPVALFPNWADIEGTRPHEGPNTYRDQWHADNQTLVVAYSGSIGKKQGIETIVATAKILRDRGSIKFVIAGDGAGRPELEVEVQRLDLKNLLLLPLAPADRLSEFLSAADVHCIPQKRAAADLVMPSKLLNILAVARPVVVSTDPETELGRTVTAARCGLVVEPENPLALANAVLALAADAPLRRSMGVAGRDFVTRHYQQDVVLRRFSSRLMNVRESSRRSAIRRP